jgi:thioredoxin reductase (NADPH)
MKTTNIAVVGAGPAGLSAALWLKNLGLTPIVIEREAKTGGMQNFNFLHNDWVLGQLAPTGLNMASSFDLHVKERAVDIRLQCSLESIMRANDGGFILSLNGQKTPAIKKMQSNSQSNSQVHPQSNSQVHSQSHAEKVYCDGIILANGTRYLGKEIMSHVAGVDLLERDDIIEGPYAFLDVERHKNKRVLIVGAGDNAFENAAMLLQQGCQVTIIARSAPSARSQFVDEVTVHPQATIMDGASIVSVKKINPTEIEVDIRSSDSSKNHPLVSKNKSTLVVNQIHILAGYCSNADTVNSLMLSGVGESLDCDSNQFLLVDRLGRTNVSHIYAAGDVCNTDFPCVVSAVASGALAAKTASQDLLG